MATFGFGSAGLGPTVVLAADGTVMETVGSGPIGSTAAAAEEGSLGLCLSGRSDDWPSVGSSGRSQTWVRRRLRDRTAMVLPA
ncbi:putative basic proline-rich protein-like [Iris pallida]|uniref:Basic proline-rich protein-like n=1 Tax=Iris pallida TaxID=29817 RepID=A0AAX6F8Q4_IRIPA|nr:putative basic proline-rich protein-like [Iris pallida]